MNKAAVEPARRRAELQEVVNFAAAERDGRRRERDVDVLSVRRQHFTCLRRGICSKIVWRFYGRKPAAPGGLWSAEPSRSFRGS